MGRKNVFIGFIVTTFSIILLTGCSSQATANKVVSALENEDYDVVSQVFEVALDNTSDKNELNDTVSAEVQLYLDEAYEEMDEDSFYSLITHIEEIGIYEKGFFSTVDNYKDLAGKEVEDDYSYTVNEINEEEEYTDEEEYDSHVEYDDDEEYYEEEVVTTTDNPYTATDIDHDCSDFETRYEAQLFYEANGGPEYDPHDLDRDNDGSACDWNP
jgi:hypothetical protein